MENFTDKQLKIVLEKSDKKLSIKWLGQSKDLEPSKKLNPYFESLLNEIDKDNEIIIDFTELEYMNSSTVQPIIFFIKKIDSMGCRALIRYDSSRKWQMLSFKALEVITKTLKNISVESR